jgi:hypothetical protein
VAERHGAVGGEVTASSAGVSETAELSALAGEWRINRGLTGRIHDLANRHKLELASEPKWAGPYTSHVTWAVASLFKNSVCRRLVHVQLEGKACFAVREEAGLGLIAQKGACRAWPFRAWLRWALVFLIRCGLPTSPIDSQACE